MLVDVAYQPLTLTYRLVGTDEVDVRGYDPTGKDVREHVSASTPEQGFASYCLAIEHRDVVFDQEPFASPNPRLSETASIIMPLSNDGSVINMLMAFVDFRRTLG